MRATSSCRAARQHNVPHMLSNMSRMSYLHMLIVYTGRARSSETSHSILQPSCKKIVASLSVLPKSCSAISRYVPYILFILRRAESRCQTAFSISSFVKGTTDGLISAFGFTVFTWRV